MSWYCPNDRCPNIKQLNRNSKCPVCTRKAEKFGGLFAHSNEEKNELLDIKNYNKTIYPQKRCDCSNLMLPIPKEITQSRFGISFNSYICLRCGISTHNFDNVDLYVLVGILLKNIDATTGYFRFNIEKPEEKRGAQTIRIVDYAYMKKLGYHREIYMKSGDSLAIGGYYENNAFIPIYYYNITANVEGKLTAMDESTSILLRDVIGDAKNKLQMTFSKNPVIHVVTEEIHEKYMNMRTQVENTRPEKVSRYISSETKREVWRRDEGKCVRCDSRKNLEYDHIIPVSKGGSNTARNIELLCEECNRQKSNNIA